MLDSTYSDDIPEDPRGEQQADEPGRDRRPLSERARPRLLDAPLPGLECGPFGPYDPPGA